MVREGIKNCSVYPYPVGLLYPTTEHDRIVVMKAWSSRKTTRETIISSLLTEMVIMMSYLRDDAPTPVKKIKAKFDKLMAPVPSSYQEDEVGNFVVKSI